MSDGATIKVRRLDLLHAKFRKLVPEVDRELIVAANTGGEEMASLARRFCTSARVKRTIKVEPLEGRPGVRVVAGDESTNLVARKGSGVYVNLALMLEFGTKKHRLGGIFKGAMHPGSKAVPYMFPAKRLTERRAKSRMGRAIGKAAKKVAAASK